jgi:Domain of unknown function (DUF4350)
MTTAVTSPAPVASAPAASAPRPKPKRRPRSRRWLRAALPFAILLGIWILTGAAHAWEEPNLDEAGTLSPTGTGADGSSRLAELLSADGVRIERVTSGLTALQAAASADSTIFVPAPDYLDRAFISDLTHVASAHRIVVVQPGLRTMVFSGIPIFPTGERWATATVAPRCLTPYAADAGPAAVFQSHYIVDTAGLPESGYPTSVDCYSGGLVGVRDGDIETIYVGATDPFRNGRIDENGNTALARALLGEYRRLVWVDVHARERASRPPIPRPDLPEYRRGEQDRTQTGFPTIDAFPAALWAGLAVACAGAFLLAVARARRLGPPVAEPLPVLVPAAESVTGRGRLYDRIGARAATLDALRSAAISRIARVLNPFGRTAPEHDILRPGAAAGGVDGAGSADGLVVQVAARTGMPEQVVRMVLYGPPPADDEGLARAVADLDALVAAVLRDNPSARTTQGGTP